jgi:hypothetical protein
MCEIRCYIEKLEMELTNGTRKQKEIHIKARAEGIEDRKRLQKTWRQQQRSGAPRMGNSEQVR